MNLIDAVKSGRKFRRKDSDDIWVQHFQGRLSQYSSFHQAHIGWSPNTEDILADDYELCEKTITITRSQFWDAVNTIEVSIRDTQFRRVKWLDSNPVIRGQLEHFAKCLGLEP